VNPLGRSPLQQTEIAQPAIFTIEYALAQLWMSWGIKPQAAIGHSIGEYVAATIAGVMSLEDALCLVAQRGKLIQQMPTGSMLAVSLSAVGANGDALANPLGRSPLQELLLQNDGLSLAAVNAPNLCVISGSDEAIARINEELTEKGVECRHLHTSHAFHSPMMDGAIAPFTQEIAKVKLNPPQMPFISNVTGTWITDEEATNPHYWAKHMRQTVYFAAGISELLQDSDRILLEVGAGRTLSTFVKHNSTKAAGQIVLSSLRHPKETVDDRTFILNMLGRLWLAGVAIDWGDFYAHQKRHRVPLPTYPFERQRYWIDRIDPPLIPPLKGGYGKKDNISDWFMFLLGKPYL
jgi:acyl transferase domain-containing protein